MSEPTLVMIPSRMRTSALYSLSAFTTVPPLMSTGREPTPLAAHEPGTSDEHSALFAASWQARKYRRQAVLQGQEAHGLLWLDTLSALLSQETARGPFPEGARSNSKR